MLEKPDINKVFKSLMVALFLLLPDPRLETEAERTDNPFNDKIVRCAIALNDDMYEKDGLEAGMNYELLKAFSIDNKCSVDIKVYTKKQNVLDSLAADKVDLVVIEKEKLRGSDKVFVTTGIANSTVWVTGNDKFNEVTRLNEWLFSYRQTDDFHQLEDLFLTSYNPARRAESGRKYNRLSPYDKIIRQEASRLGWDWKMLVAVLWQESKFSINSRSHRGAMGLMQVMPKTGLYYDVTNLLDPYENMEAGTKHLNRVQRIFRKYNLTDQELVKFTLAAYNAGEGRILDCMNLAEHEHKDKTRWDDIVSIIPLMNDVSALDSGIVRLGNFKGVETITYVDNIMSIYEDLCQISRK